jgi:hypothetical protein
MSESTAANEPSASVCDRVLSVFVDAIAEDPYVGDIADRLRETVLVNGDVSEPALRKALFGGDEP